MGPGFNLLGNFLIKCARKSRICIRPWSLPSMGEAGEEDSNMVGAIAGVIAGLFLVFGIWFFVLRKSDDDENDDNDDDFDYEAFEEEGEDEQSQSKLGIFRAAAKNVAREFPAVRRKANALQVHVVECKNLKNTQTLGKQDPYAKLKFGKAKFHTKVCSNKPKACIWNEKFLFPLPKEFSEDSKEELYISVRNQNTMGRTIIGEGKVAIHKFSPTFNDDADDSWYPIFDSKKKQSGELRLKSKLIKEGTWVDGKYVPSTYDYQT